MSMLALDLVSMFESILGPSNTSSMRLRHVCSNEPCGTPQNKQSNKPSIDLSQSLSGAFSGEHIQPLSDEYHQGEIGLEPLATQQPFSEMAG